VGDRRLGHLDRGLRRMLRHLDRRAPLVGFSSFVDCLPLSATSKLKARRKPGFFSCVFFLVPISESTGHERPLGNSTVCGECTRETESPAPETHDTQTTSARNSTRLDIHQRNSKFKR